MTYRSRGSRWLALMAPARAVALDLGLLLLLLASGRAQAQTLPCTAPATSGEVGWLDATWTGSGCTNRGNSNQPVPGTLADVVIPSGSTIRCGLNPTSTPAAPTLGSLTVNGVLNMGSNSTAGGLVIKGDLTVNNGGTIENGAPAQVNSISVGGKWVNNGTFTPGTGSTVTPRIDVAISGTSIGGSATTTFNNLTLSATSPVAVTANVTVNGAITCASTISAVGTTFNYNQGTAGQNVCTGNYGNLTFSNFAKTLASSGTIAIAGTFSAGTATPTMTGSTVSFTGAGQTIPVLPYINLDISSTGADSLAGITTVTGILSLTKGTLAVAANTLTASGALTLTSGTLSVTTGSVTASGTVNCNGGTVLSTGGLVSYTGAALQNVCPGTYIGLTFNATTKTLNGTINIAGAFSPGAATGNVVTGSTVNLNQASAGQAVPAFNYNNLTLSSFNKTLVNGGTIGIAGTFTPGAGTRTVTGNTVSFNGSGNQTIPAMTYNNLQTAVGGIKTASATFTVNGTLTVASGTTYSQTAGNLTAGTLAISGLFQQKAGNLTPGTITVNSGGSFQYGGTGTITIGAGGVSNSGVFVVDGNGGGCHSTAVRPPADAQATITAGGVRNWTGGGTFQLTDVSIQNQNKGGTNVTAYHATNVSGNAGFTFVNDCTGAPTAVRLASFTATAHGGRVLLRWQTAMETNNIGFRLYREAGDASSLVTPHLISGSALTAGLRTALSGGRSYVWWDDLPAGAAAAATRYWLADVDLRGGQSLHGPVVPKPSHEPAPDVRDAPHLQQLAGSNGASASPGSSGQGGPAGWILPGLSPTTPNTTAVQWGLASARALKIGISHAGWYRVTGRDLTDHGLGNVDPSRLQLFADGQQIPLVMGGLARGRSIVPESTAEFYATGIDSPWSSERTYWLAAGTSAGKRIGKVSATATDAAPASFAFTVESAPKAIYFPALMNGDGSKYFGPLVATDAQAPTTLTLDVRHAAPAGQAALDVAVQGVTDGTHVVAVLLNGKPVGQVELDGQQLGTAHLQLDQSASLVEGSNQIALWAEGGEMDLSLVQSVGLTYWRRYVADGDTLSMTAPADSHLVVGGFFSPHIHVMDVTDPENPYELVAAVQNDGSSYAVAANVAGAGVRDLLAFTDEKVEPPASLKTNSPSNWHSADKAANLVILTHAAVADALTALVRLRQAQGYIVAVVDVEDVYDEFSFGNKTPQAIRDFLAHATSTWHKRPAFLLLAGSASSDPRNFLGYGDFDLVPTKFVEATYSQAASDDWFVDFNDDGLPDLAIGRLPVRDATQAAAVVQKLVGYGHAGGADWKRTAVLVADTADAQFDYAANTDAVAAQIPSNIFLKQVFRGDFGDDTLAHATVLGAFNQGALLVNYMGHSSETAWRANLLTVDDVPLLTNGLRLPFVSSMTCWTGLFVDPVAETLGESLLKAPQGGAIAVWASSGMTESDGQTVLDKELMRLLFSARKPTIGEATAGAKAATGDLDVRRTWILLGDPAMKLE